MDSYVQLLHYIYIYIAEFFSKCELIQTTGVEKFKVHILCSVILSDLRPFCEIM
jgi:hypothetical protein